jgi:hypothetical protein
VYSIQLIIDSWHVGSFLQVPSFSSINVFYYLNAFEIWLEKRGDFGGRSLIRGRQLVKRKEMSDTTVQHKIFLFIQLSPFFVEQQIPIL